MKVIGRSARKTRLHKRHQNAEINLTSMIDMMTILVFFLLVHGGFIRLAMLELTLPASQSEPGKEPPTLQLEITVRESEIEVGDRSAGALSRIEKGADGYDLAKLTEYLHQAQGAVPRQERRDAAARAEHPVRRARRGHGQDSGCRAARCRERPSSPHGAVPGDFDRRRAGA